MIDDAEQAIRDGARATDILNDPVFLGAVEKVRGAIIREWQESGKADLHAEYAAVARILARLRDTADLGVKAKKDVEKANRQRTIK